MNDARRHAWSLLLDVMTDRIQETRTMLPQSFYAHGVTDFDTAGWQADPDDVHYQERKAQATLDFVLLGEIPPAIHCVADLKRAWAELAVLLRDRAVS